MGLSVQQVIAKRRQLRVEASVFGFPGEYITLAYRPNFFDESTEIELNRILADTGGNVVKSYELFIQSVTDWDLLGEDGQPVPLTVPGLQANRVPTRVCTYLMERIVEDNTLGEASAGRTGSTSAPQANSASSPNGTPGSWLPSGMDALPGS
jgi:hypothetical protein